MEDLIELFDSLLTLMVSFPATIFHVLASPDKVVGMEPNTLVSPPGATLVISFIIWYFSHSMETKIKYALDLPSAPSKTFIVRVFVVVTFMLLVQYLALLIPSVVPVPPADPVETVKALSYPVSVSMAIYGLVYLIYILFPIGSKPHGMTVQEKLDSVARKVRKEWGTKRIVAEENAGSLALLAGILVYIYALYNILQVLFNLSFPKTIFPTVVLLITSILLMVLFSYIVFGRLDGLADKLKSQKEAMPNKGNSGEEHQMQDTTDS
jgi:uncharacterized integral membrane protein